MYRLTCGEYTSKQIALEHCNRCNCFSSCFQSFCLTFPICQCADCRAVGCIFGEFLLKAPLLPGKTELDQFQKIVDLIGAPTERSWPGFTSLPGAEVITGSSATAAPRSTLASRFPTLSANVRRLRDFTAKADVKSNVFSGFERRVWICLKDC